MSNRTPNPAWLNEILDRSEDISREFENLRKEARSNQTVFRLVDLIERTIRIDEDGKVTVVARGFDLSMLHVCIAAARFAIGDLDDPV